MGRVVVVGEVEDEEIEGVPGHEPPADGGRVRIDRAGRPVAPREGCAGAVRAEEVVEEEALGPANVAQERQQGAMRRSSPVGGEVDGCGAEAGVGERLEQGHCPCPEVLPVHVDERVPQRLADAGDADCAERAAVLDETLLPAVEPGEMRDLVDVAVPARRDGGQADGGQRGKHRRGAPVGAAFGEAGQCRGVPGSDCALQHRRGEAVDDDQDQRPGAHFASERSPAYFSGPPRARRAATTGNTTASR